MKTIHLFFEKKMSKIFPAENTIIHLYVKLIDLFMRGVSVWIDCERVLSIENLRIKTL